MSRHWIAALLLVGCRQERLGPDAGGGGDGTRDTGVSLDTGDSAAETGTDTGADTGDSATDTGDSGTDTAIDTGDSGTDTAIDTGDSGTDTAIDTGDTAVEDTGDTAVEDTGDTAVEDTGDSGTDTAIDTGDTAVEDTGDSGTDTAVDTGDTGTDTAIDTGDTAVEDTGDTDESWAPAVTYDLSVCGDGTGDYTTIQEAVDAASPGDSISVCAGTYDAFSVEWSWEVAIVGTDGAAATLIDGGADPAVIVNNGTLSLTGFTITGTGTDTTYDKEGAALSVHEGDLTVTDCIITGTTGDFTLLFDENFLAMDGVEWIDNETQFLWYLSEGDNADIHDNIVRGGVHETVVTTPDMDNLRMTDNLFTGIRIETGYTAFDFYSNGVGTIGVYNNVFYDVDDADPWGGRVVDLDGADFRNNIVSECDSWNPNPMAADYNLFHEDDIDYSTSVTGTGNLYADPLFVDPAGEDFSLQAASPGIDAGDPDDAYDDADGSRNDMGLTGGPWLAEREEYVPETDPEPDSSAAWHTLTVTDGFGGGSYQAGEMVNVWADVDPATEIVTGWTGGTLEEGDEWNGRFTMPDADATLAPILDAEEIPFTEATFTLAGSDRLVLYAIPSSPRAMVYFAHSALGNREEIYDNGPYTVARVLYDAGFGIVAMDSDIATNAGSGGWSDATDDETLDLAAIRELIVAFAMWGTPTVVWGTGSGGMFAHAVGVALPADGVISYCAPGRRWLVSVTEAPTAWFLAERDSTYLTAIEDATAWAEDLEDRGVTAEVNVHRPTPLYAERFTRVAGVDAATSADIAAGLLADGHVDADGNWLVTGEDAVDNLWIYGLTYDQHEAVVDEIRIMAADGEQYDDHAQATLDFLDPLFP